MCVDCGCDHQHDHHHHEDQQPPPTKTRTLVVEEDLLAKNKFLAEENRGMFTRNHILALNLLSSPGSGKTTLLEQSIRRLQPHLAMTVIEGDQQTTRDAERISATGVPVFQVNTGTGCHLDAAMVRHAFEHLAPPENSVLFIENVGNLVCPAMFDLGEHNKVVIISVTEGEDKPIKYPYIFREADICVITKTDLLPHLDFDLAQCREFASQVNPQLTIFEVSAKSGAGMAEWCDWLRQQQDSFLLADTPGAP